MNDYLWITDPDSGQQVRVSYDDLDSDVYPQLFKPTGGFCYEATSFLQLDLPAVPYFIKGWLPKQGKCLIYGKAKSGKSYLTYQLARCIAQGTDFLGLPTTKGRVLILQFELGESVVQHRLKSTGQDYSNVYIGTSFGLKLDKTSGKEQFTKALDSVSPDVVIIDPFIKVLSGEENDSHDVLKITDEIDKQLDQRKISCVVIHHPGHDLSKGARGSSVLEGWVDSYIELRNMSIKGDSDLTIKLTPKLLRHAELPPDPIQAVMKSGTFEFELGAPSPTIKKLVLEHLQKSWPNTVSIRQLLLQKFGSRKSVTNALEALMDEGVVVKPERGEYCIRTEASYAEFEPEELSIEPYGKEESL